MRMQRGYGIHMFGEGSIYYPKADVRGEERKRERERERERGRVREREREERETGRDAFRTLSRLASPTINFFLVLLPSSPSLFIKEENKVKLGLGLGYLLAFQEVRKQKGKWT